MTTPSEEFMREGSRLWIECLEDGAPDAGLIIATALRAAVDKAIARAIIAEKETDSG